MKEFKPPVYSPIQPLRVSNRWFPPKASFGLYRLGHSVAPNVTSILSAFFPFDIEAWKKAEPGIDHAVVTKESAQRGTAVHLAMENWLIGKNREYNSSYRPWVEPLQLLVSRASATLAVELPVFCNVGRIGSYAGSADALMRVGDDIVLIDYKTKRENKNVYPRYLLKQKLQMAAYVMAINSIYCDQLPSPVARASLLFAHPDEGRKVTVVKIGASEIKDLQDQWACLLAEWYVANQASLVACNVLPPAGDTEPA